MEIRQYRVEADANTGEWLGEPEYAGMVDEASWSSKDDTEARHFDTYEVQIKDGQGFPTLDSETRAIEVIWVA